MVYTLRRGEERQIMRNNQTKEVADMLAFRLLAANFIVQRYDAYSTSSVYLKLDYGLGNSVRIADHRGKKNLQYRFNLMFGMSGVEQKLSKTGLPQYYYGLDSVEIMIQNIIQAKQGKIKKYRGLSNYQSFMQENRQNNEGQRGFWSQAYRVALDANGSVVRIGDN